MRGLLYGIRRILAHSGHIYTVAVSSPAVSACTAPIQFSELSQTHALHANLHRAATSNVFLFGSLDPADVSAASVQSSTTRSGENVSTERLVHTEVSAADLQTNQNLFRSVGAFEQCVSILNSTMTESILKSTTSLESTNMRSQTSILSQLCMDLCRTITALLRGNAQAKDAFRDTIGICCIFIV